MRYLKILLKAPHADFSPQTLFTSTICTPPVSAVYKEGINIGDVQGRDDFSGMAARLQSDFKLCGMDPKVLGQRSPLNCLKANTRPSVASHVYYGVLRVSWTG